MTIEIKKGPGEAIIKVAGVLDDITAKSLGKIINDASKEASSIILDLSGVKELSTAGLSTILDTRESISSSSSLRLTGARESVMRVVEAFGI